MKKHQIIPLITGYISGVLLVTPVRADSNQTGNVEKPNVILILSDDHSAPFLGCYGNKDLKTPNIDRLASEGILFKKAYTTAPQCVPSRSSILTGRNVLDVQMLRFSAPLDKEIVTFPEIFRKSGYYTGICGRSYHLDGSGNKPAETIEAFREFQMVTFEKRVDYLRTGSDEKVISQVKEFLDLVPGKSPFCLWINYSDPHRIFNAKEYEPYPDKIHLPELFPDTKLLRQDLSGYMGEVQRLDERIGVLIAELEGRNLLDNSLLVFMGDNGGALLRGKGTLYDLGIHVPLIVRWPGKIKPGRVSGILVSGEDIAPTLLEAAGFNPDEKMTGISFLRTLAGEERDSREYVFAVRGAHGSGLPGTSSAFDLSRLVFNKKFKLIYNPLFILPYHPVDFAGLPFWNDLIERNKNEELAPMFSGTYIFTSQRPIFELYDLEKDPDEFINLSGKEEYREVEHQMKSVLHKWMIRYRDVVPLPVPPGG